MTRTLRFFTTTIPQRNASPKQRSRHASFYSDSLPAMIPVFLLGSTIFLGLQLTQLTLAHEKFTQESNARVIALEAEIDQLHTQANSSVAAAHSETARGTSPSLDSGTDSQSNPASSFRWWKWW